MIKFKKILLVCIIFLGSLLKPCILGDFVDALKEATVANMK